MTKLLKGKHVLLCSEITDLSLQVVDILFKNKVKSVTITNQNGDIFNEFQNNYRNEKLFHVPANLNTIEDLEEVYKVVLHKQKKIDIVINNKELSNDNNWEDTITKQINSIICSTLLAMKHLGSMNGGRGCMVLNMVSLFDNTNADGDPTSSNYECIKNLLADLDQSFGNAYYHASTRVRILTMCSYMEMREMQSDIEQAFSVPQGSSYLFARFDNVEKRLLAVITDKVSDLQEAGKKQVEEFQIVVEPNK